MNKCQKDVVTVTSCYYYFSTEGKRKGKRVEEVYEDVDPNMIASSTTPQAQGRFDLTDCPAYVGTKLTDKL